MLKCTVIEKLLKDNSLEAYNDHLQGYCSECLLNKIRNRPNKVEIFPKGPPWIELEKSNTEEPEEKAFPSKRKKTEKVQEEVKKTRIAPEEVDAYLVECVVKGKSDKEIMFEIKKHKGLDKEGCRELAVQLLSKHSDERKLSFLKKRNTDAVEPKEKTKVVNETSLLPWTPFPRVGFEEKPSEFPEDKQKRYVSIVSSLLQSGVTRFESNNLDIKTFNTNAEEERSHFASAAIAFFNETNEINEDNSNPITYLSKMVQEIIHKRHKKRWNRDKLIFSCLPLTEVEFDENIPNVPNLSPKMCHTLLPGRNEVFNFPNLQLKCQINTKDIKNNYPIDCIDMFPIESDEQAKAICHENSIKFVMDATTACHLMVDAFPGRDYNYAIPVTVDQEMYKGAWCTTVILGKPRIFGKVRNNCITQKILKASLKATFVKHNRKHKSKLITLRKKNGETEEGGREEICPNEGANDPLDNIMSAIVEKEKETPSENVDNGKRYSSFAIGMNQVLIRSTPPFIASGNSSKFISSNTVIVEPFHELLSSFSAMAYSDEYLLYLELKKLFKQGDLSVVMRMALDTHMDGSMNVLQVQPRIDQLSNERERIEVIIQLLANRTKRLDDILAALNPLIPGKYMIVNERDSKIKILQETDEKNSEIFPETRDYTTGAEPQPIEEIFSEFEKKVPLQWQIVGFMAPGCYLSETKLEKLSKIYERNGSFNRGSRNKWKGKSQTRGSFPKRGRGKRGAPPAGRTSHPKGQGINSPQIPS